MASNKCVLRAYEIDDDGSHRPAGYLAADERGMLRILEAVSEDDRVQLDDLIGQLNSQPDMKVRVPPPPDAERYELHSKVVERDDAAFIDALREHTRRYHGYELEVTTDEVPSADEPAEFRSDPFRPSATEAEFPPRELPDF